MNFLNNEIIEASEAIASELKDLPEQEQIYQFRTAAKRGYTEMLKNGIAPDDAKLQVNVITDHVKALLATPNPEIKNFVDLAVADFQMVTGKHRAVIAGRMLQEITNLDLPVHEKGELLLMLGARLNKIDEIKFQ